MCAKRAQLRFEALDPLDIAQDDADAVRIELEIVADARGGLRDCEVTRFEGQGRSVRIAGYERAVAHELGQLAFRYPGRVHELRPGHLGDRLEVHRVFDEWGHWEASR